MQPQSSSTAPPALDPQFLNGLTCPACDERPPLALAASGWTLDCAVCGRRYPIEPDGIPVLLVEKAVLPERGTGRQTE